jgi:hypothetical protein
MVKFRTVLAVLFLLPGLVGAIVGPLLVYVTPSTTTVVLNISKLYLLMLAGCSVVALVRKRWRPFAIYCLPLLAVAFFWGSDGPAFMAALGFRARIYPAVQYAESCGRIQYVENGQEQEVGLCEIITLTRLDFVGYVVYDTAGQLLYPVARRTQAWKDAMRSVIPNGRILADFELTAQHLFGPYYIIDFRSEDAARE